MKRALICLVFVIMLSSLASSEIIINQQPKEFYNIGEVINVPLKIVTIDKINDFFSMHILCNGIETEVHKEYISLRAGEEKAINPSLPLIKSLVGRSTGVCKIKAILGEQYILTNEFEISDLINIKLLSEQREFEPGKDIIIEGEALRKNGEAVKGMVELRIIESNTTLVEVLDSVKNGYFFLNFSMPPQTKAGQYLVSINVYEKDFEEEISNRGFTDFNILIKQIPTNLEIFFENSEIEPGTNLKVKAILHDQTGEKISSNATITIKNKDNQILEQTEKQTDEFLEYFIPNNEPPSNWSVVAVSNKLTAEAVFRIKEKEEVKVELINKTITLTNIGNVPYNKTVSIKIENESLGIDVSLEIGESKKYLITAPDGKYQVEILTDEGKKITGMATLTGREIGIRELSKERIKKSIIWVVMIFVLGLIAFLFFRKARKKNFLAFISKKKEAVPTPVKKEQEPITDMKNKAELSLSIKGDKQDVSLVCLKIKNIQNMKTKSSNVKETLQKIIKEAEENKAIVYKSQDSLFFILAPIKTKTFKNEKAAINIAQKIKEILTDHNRLFKQKIEFGISLNYGTIIAKPGEIFKFMSMGTLITLAKKISSLSKQEILLSENMNERVLRYAKTEKSIRDKIPVYVIKEIKDTEENQKFIRNFLERIGKK